MSTEAGTTKTPVILLVEDSEDDAFFFQRALKRTDHPYRFFHVADGQEALDFLSGKAAFAAPHAAPAPDLLFLDLKLPKFNGFDVLRWIQAQGQGSHLKVVVLSGSDQETDRDLARQLGAADYVVKPVHPEYLAAALQAVQKPSAG